MGERPENPTHADAEARDMIVSSQTDNHQHGPYASAAQAYWTAGWRGVLPLPARQKTPVPKGHTGAGGAWPSYPDVHAWTEDHAGGNIALRLPVDVIGIDVDHYGDKPGGLVLTQLEQQLGGLPATWRTTSRDDGHSGIRLYRVPAGLRWPGGLGPGIDTIRHDHRYALVWPSIHPSGGTYRWITPDGATALGVVPTPDDLPDLPDAWVEHFTGGQHATDQPHAGLDAATSSAWLAHRGAGAACDRTSSALRRALDDLTAATSRHDSVLASTNRLIWLAGEGHSGTTTALQQLGAAFLAAISRDRGDGEAEAEWDRMILGAVDIAAAAHPEPSPDPCTDPYRDVRDLIGKEKACAPTAPEPTSNGSTPPTSAAPSPTSSSDASAADESSESTSPETEPERTSWWPRSLDAALGNTDPEPPPAHLTRGDGHAAFYRGRVNGLIGPSESGKTWVALHAAAQAVDVATRVTYIDFEDSDVGITGRLLSLGCEPAALEELFAYIGPDEPFHPLMPTGIDLADHLEQHQPDLILLDGVNAAMTLQGWDLNSNKDATAFAQQILKPLTKNGAAVVYIDHTPKDTENASKGGIGAQAKRAMTSGCTLRVDAVKPFGKGQDGKLRIHVDKDRQGDVRGVSAPGKTSHWFGDFILAHVGDGAVSASLDAPAGFDPANPTAAPEFRPTGLMKKVSDYLEQHPGAGVREVKDAGLGRNEYVSKALVLLVDEGWVRVGKGSRGKSEHHLDTPFDELLAPPNDRGPDCGPTVARGHAQSTVAPWPPDPDVVRSERGTVETREGDATDDRAPGPRSSRTVERTIAGKRVRVDLDTGEVV